MRHHTLTAGDGTPITLHCIDDGATGIPLVMSGGLAGRTLIWSDLGKRLRVAHPIIMWDYPGLFETPPTRPPAHLSVEMLANCLWDMLDQEQIGPHVQVGWSMGVQVALASSARRPDRVKAIIALNGGADSPFRSLHRIFRLNQPVARLEKLKKRLAKADSPRQMALRLGLISQDANPINGEAILRHFLSIDPVSFGAYLQALATHDGTTVSKRLTVPILVFKGERDRLTLPGQCEALSTHGPHRELFTAKGATHFLPIEYPDVIAIKTARFLKEHVL